MGRQAVRAMMRPAPPQRVSPRFAPQAPTPQQRTQQSEAPQCGVHVVVIQQVGKQAELVHAIQAACSTDGVSVHNCQRLRHGLCMMHPHKAALLRSCVSTHPACVRQGTHLTRDEQLAREAEVFIQPVIHLSRHGDQVAILQAVWVALGALRLGALRLVAAALLPGGLAPAALLLLQRGLWVEPATQSHTQRQQGVGPMVRSIKRAPSFPSCSSLQFLPTQTRRHQGLRQSGARRPLACAAVR